jgi:IclR family transcriptional regulator, KDG regulon repressor
MADQYTGERHTELGTVAKSTHQKPRAKQADKNYIAVMAKIFAVLEYAIDRGGRQEPIAFAELAKDLPYSRTTIHRILYSLEKLGYVEKAEGTARYRLAAKFFALTGVAVNFRQLQSVAKPVMQNLMTRHAETVNLGVLDRGQVVFIDVLQSPSSLRIAAYPGERCAVHSTALGKALLAFLPEAEIQAILSDQPLTKKTPQTITRKSHFMENLGTVREHGVALDLEENLSGVTCIAAPIFNDAQRVIAGFSISGPSARMHAKLSAVKEDVRSAALMVTRMLAPLSNVGEIPKIQKRRNNPFRAG